MDKYLKRLKDSINNFMNGFSKHDILTLAAALAFYTALSLAPILLLIITIVGLLGSGAENHFMGQVQALMGQEATQAIKMIIKNAGEKPELGNFAGIFGLITLAFSASAVFSQLQTSFNIIWESEPPQDKGWLIYLRKRIFSMGMVLALAFLSLVSLAVNAALASILPNNSEIWRAVNGILSLFLFTFLFALIFKYLPDKKILWKPVLKGGFITAALFIVGKFLIGFYLGKSALGSAYGAAGSLIVLLAWVYYSSIIVFIGAELTRAAFHTEG